MPDPRILVVEDETNVRELEAEILREEWEHVDTAVDGTDALRLLAEHVYAAIVSDLAMPKMDGRGLYEEVGRRYPSAHGRPRVRDRLCGGRGVRRLPPSERRPGAGQAVHHRRPDRGGAAGVLARLAEPPVALLAGSSEQRYRALVESSAGLICTHDMSGLLLSVNRAAADRLGYAADELVGRSLGDLLAPSVQAQFPGISSASPTARATRG